MTKYETYSIDPPGCKDIADALHFASDHLPVSVEIIFSNDIVDPVNLAPLVSDTAFNINEFPSDGIIIGKIISQDPENEPLSYSIISGNDQNIFSIDNDGLEILFFTKLIISSPHKYINSKLK